MNTAISQDEYPTRKHSLKEGCPIEKDSTTQRFMKNAKDEKVFYTLLVAIICYIASSLMDTRDSTIVQEYIDRAQDQRMNVIEKHVTEIGTDVKTLLKRGE